LTRTNFRPSETAAFLLPSATASGRCFHLGSLASPRQEPPLFGSALRSNSHLTGSWKLRDARARSTRLQMLGSIQMLRALGPIQTLELRALRAHVELEIGYDPGTRRPRCGAERRKAARADGNALAEIGCAPPFSPPGPLRGRRAVRRRAVPPPAPSHSHRAVACVPVPQRRLILWSATPVKRLHDATNGCTHRPTNKSQWSETAL